MVDCGQTPFRVDVVRYSRGSVGPASLYFHWLVTSEHLGGWTAPLSAVIRKQFIRSGRAGVGPGRVAAAVHQPLAALDWRWAVVDGGSAGEAVRVTTPTPVPAPGTRSAQPAAPLRARRQRRPAAARTAPKQRRRWVAVLSAYDACRVRWDMRRHKKCILLKIFCPFTLFLAGSKLFGFVRGGASEAPPY